MTVVTLWLKYACYCSHANFQFLKILIANMNCRHFLVESTPLYRKEWEKVEFVPEFGQFSPKWWKKWPNFDQPILDSKNGQNLACSTAFESCGHRHSKTVLQSFLASTVWEISRVKIGQKLAGQSVCMPIFPHWVNCNFHLPKTLPYTNFQVSLIICDIFT